VSARASSIRGLLAVAALALVTPLGAQTPPAAPAGQPAAQGRGGGGGRGRGPVRDFVLQTNAFTDGGQIPAKYAQPGHDVSPALSWSGAPDSTASYVLIVHDANFAIGNGTDDMLQWMVWNIPGSATLLAEHLPAVAQLPDGSRQISGTGPYYRGPNAPSTGPVHHIVFELFALDGMIDVPAVGAAPPATRAAVVAAMGGHIRGKAVLSGVYRRAAP
jgi:Raf kinase inhibitor-like YbhB/YbcL family protein